MLSTPLCPCSVGARYISVSAYQASRDDEVSFVKGAIVKLIKKYADGWWLVRYVCVYVINTQTLLIVKAKTNLKAVNFQRKIVTSSLHLHVCSPHHTEEVRKNAV